MKKTLFLFLIFLPMSLLAQQLECCESEKDVETYLNGKWIVKDSDLKRQYSYRFNDGVGKFQIYEVKEKEDLEDIKKNQPTLKIFKTKAGFEIEHDFGVLKTYSKIKSLDSIKLVIIRRDGSEKEYSKISE